MGTVEVPLSRGMVAVVDERDWPAVSQHKWYASPNKRRVYAQRSITGGKSVKMHRFIVGAPKGMVVDHINGDGLDNRRENLRVVSQEENSRNRPGKGDHCASKYVGVVIAISAKIGVNGETVKLGYFRSEEEAAKAYDEACRKFFPDSTPPNGF